MTTPIERNARWLIGVMVRHFSNGATSEDLRKQFERDTGLVRQSFYNALSYVKRQGWFVRDEVDRLYRLNADASWKKPVASIGDVGERLKKTQLEEMQLDNDRLEYLAGSQERQIGELQNELELLRDWSSGSDANGEANVALESLARIVAGSSASTRQRLRAAAAILSYQVHDDAVTTFVKRFLESVCASADIAIDYKVEAAELLRKHEAPRVVSETVRPAYRIDDDPVESPPEPLADLVARQRARANVLQQEMARELGLRPGAGRMINGNGEVDDSGAE